MWDCLNSYLDCCYFCPLEHIVRMQRINSYAKHSSKIDRKQINTDNEKKYFDKSYKKSYSLSPSAGGCLTTDTGNFSNSSWVHQLFSRKAKSHLRKRLKAISLGNNFWSIISLAESSLFRHKHFHKHLKLYKTEFSDLNSRVIIKSTLTD